MSVVQAQKPQGWDWPPIIVGVVGGNLSGFFTVFAWHPIARWFFRLLFSPSASHPLVTLLVYTMPFLPAIVSLIPPALATAVARRHVMA
jgi:hypothetical protein